MFYKTTVHSLVPGGVVDSRGKTLTFIGNKVARVGDTIWTDGRVVFGHTPARGSPILAGGDEAIPVLIYDNGEYNFYTFRENKLVKLPTQENFASGNWGFINDNKKNAYIDTKSSSEVIKYVPAITRPNPEYPSSALETITIVGACWIYKKTLAFNIDKAGNFYELEIECEQQEADEHFGEVRVYNTVCVKKNGVVLKKMNFKDKAEKLGLAVRDFLSFETHKRLLQIAGTVTTTNYGTYTPSCDTNVLWGVIEDENNWAFIIQIYGNNRSEGHTFDAGVVAPVPNPVEPSYVSVWGSMMESIYYFCTPEGTVELCNIRKGSIYGYYLLSPEDVSYFPYWSFDQSCPAEKIPIQNGYFFKINELSLRYYDPPPPTHGETYFPGQIFVDTSPIYMQASIYTPHGKLLYSGKFTLGTYFTICKYKKCVLFGVNDSGRRNLKADLSDVGTGIFVVGKEQTLEILAEGDVRNWKLRPMKHYKNWHKCIQKIKLI